MSNQCERAVELLSGARRVVALTGAGMSQESGVPTFRDAQTGLWERYDPTELATAAAFQHNPARVFGWYLWRWQLVRKVAPHAGHRALAALVRAFDELVVVTQNVDGLHRRAGSPDVTELHGSIDAFRCFDQGHPYDPAGLESLELPESGEVQPPECHVCGSPVRPGVVWFGEFLPQDALERACRVVTECDALLVIGTSALVYPAADLPNLGLSSGATVIEINPQRTPLTPRVRLSWPASAGAALPALSAALGQPVAP